MMNRTLIFGRDSGGSDSSLVPIADRVLYLDAYRVAAVGLVLATYWTVPHAVALGTNHFAALVAGYVALSLASAFSWLLPRQFAVTVYGFSLLVDAAFVCAVSSTATGFVSPLRYLILVHLVVVTLLAGYRTGMKLVVWYGLLTGVEFQLRAAGYLGGFDDPSATQRLAPELFALVVAFAAVTFSTALASAVNERELRRRSVDLGALAKLAWRLETKGDAASCGQALVDAVDDNFDVGRVALLQWNECAATILACKGIKLEELAGKDVLADELVSVAAGSDRTLLVSKLHPIRDAWLHAALDGAPNVVLVPLRADSETVGILVFGHGLRRGSRIERRVVTTIERFASQTALALVNAGLIEHITRLASTDGLTGVLNRRALDEYLNAEVSRSMSGVTHMTAALIDIDHFKKVNDNHGHAVGDEVLRQVASTVAQSCRPGDIVARYGGEELAVLLPDTTMEAAALVCERIRKAVADIVEPVAVTVSVGHATTHVDAETASTLIEAADRALYDAKRNGRNRVIAHHQIQSMVAVEALS